MPLHPDAVVDAVLDELAFEGTSGVRWDALWPKLAARIPAVQNEAYRQMLYSWLKDDSNIELIRGTEPVTPPPETFDDAKDCHVRVSEEYQWIALTGSPKHNNPVGASAFQLLVTIAQGRSEGVDSVQLIQQTGQDKRSLTSRIKSISHLITRMTILRNGRKLSLFTLHRFHDASREGTLAINSQSDSLTLNLKELRGRVVAALKAAKNGIRQLNDLRRELEMDKTQRYRVMFKSVVTYLQHKGCVAKVLVVSPVAPTKKFRSLKYLADYNADEKEDTENGDAVDDDDEEDFNDDLVDDTLKELDDEEPSGSLRNVVNLQVVSAEDHSVAPPLLNRFYPAHTQLYEYVHQQGTAGCSSTTIANDLFGPMYSRLFSRWVEQWTPGKFLPHMANYAVIRHYDFQGRMKFYRYLSRPNLLAFSGLPEDPHGSSLPQYKPVTTTLEEQEKKHFVPLGSRVDVIKEGGKDKIIWFGTLLDLAPEVRSLLRERSTSATDSLEATAEPELPKRKRGRPRKGEERPKVEVKKPKKVKTPKPKPEKVEKPEQVEPVADAEQLVVADLQGHSFKSIERLSALLRLLEQNNGARVDNYALYNDFCEVIGYFTDRKTFRRDIDSLISQKKVYTEELMLGPEDDDEDYGEEARRPALVTLLIVSHASKDAVEAFKQQLIEERQSRAHKITKLDEVNGVEMEFFDQQMKDEFETPVEVREEKPVQTQTTKKQSVKKKPTETPKKGKQTATGSVKASVPADPTATADQIFSGSQKKKSGPRRKQAQHVIEDVELVIPRKKKVATAPQPKKPRERSSHTRKRRGQLNSKDMLLLFKAVIIFKTVNRNHIDWDQIATLFETATGDELRAKWPRVRTMMGPSGFDTARKRWKQILLKAVKDGAIDLNEIEDVKLKTLMDLWKDDELGGVVDDGAEKLYADVEENYERYGFVKKPEPDPHAQYDFNSMVQREQYLVSKAFTFDIEEEDVDAKPPTEEMIRRTIIALVSSGGNFEIKKLSVLDQFNEEQVNEVFLSMCKKRELVVNAADQKVLLGDRIQGILDDTTFDFSMEKVCKFQELLKELCTNDKGLVLDPVFDNSIMVPVLELIKDQSLNITRVDHYRKAVLNGYEARTLEREKLDCDIILSKGGDGIIKSRPEKSVLVPMGKPCTRVWINVQGNINKEVWRKVVRAVLVSVLSQPGVTLAKLHDELAVLLTRGELEEVVKWLIESGAVMTGEEGGHWLRPQWYIVLGLY